MSALYPSLEDMKVDHMAQVFFAIALQFCVDLMIQLILKYLHQQF